MHKKIVVSECRVCPYRKSNPEINVVLCTYKEDKILSSMDWAPEKKNGIFTLLDFPTDCPLDNEE